MDQAVLAGLGNTMSDEVLWRNRIHPGRRGDSLSRVEVQRLHDQLRGGTSSVMRVVASRGARLASQRGTVDPVCPGVVTCRKPFRRPIVLVPPELPGGSSSARDE